MNEQRVLIIAEAGVNHNGDMNVAHRLVDAAAAAGADVVKFQTFRARKVAAPSAPKAGYQQRHLQDGADQLGMLQRLELDKGAHAELMAHARDRGIAFLSTPFDLDSVALLRDLGITTGKVPSGEITHLPYLKAMASSFPDLVVSTGMCTLEDVRNALDVLLAHGAELDRITLLHCNTEYPTPYEDVNLRAMTTLARTFGTRVGYSDHTLGIEVPIAATALGATVIEKHFTLDRSLPGPDHKASLEPDELKAMVRSIRHISMALGNGEKLPSKSETANIAIARKSIHLIRGLAKGACITPDDLVMLRPGDGITPMRIDEVVGRHVVQALPAGHKLAWSDLL